MSTVREILGNKLAQNENGDTVFTVPPATTVHDAVLLMNDQHIGALVVMHSRHRHDVLGIFTERDLLRRVVGERRDPDQTTVADVMTQSVACCPIDTPIDEARSVMKNHRIRHLPVIDHTSETTGQTTLLGMISIGDLNAHRVDSQAQTIDSLKEYLYGTMV